jgi:hypothetical protein
LIIFWGLGGKPRGYIEEGDHLCYFSAFWGEFIGCTPLNGVGLGPNRRGGFLRTTSGGRAVLGKGNVRGEGFVIR